MRSDLPVLPVPYFSTSLGFAFAESLLSAAMTGATVGTLNQGLTAVGAQTSPQD